VRESTVGDGSFTILVLFSLGFLVYVLIFALFQVRSTIGVLSGLIFENIGRVTAHI
jgi:hypothetical protein